MGGQYGVSVGNASRGGEGTARCPSCSQNAHDQNVLVRCAQLRATLAAPLKNDEESSKGYARRAVEDSSEPSLGTRKTSKLKRIIYSFPQSWAGRHS